MIDRIYRITVVGDSSWRVERPVSHPNPNSLNSVNSVNTVSKTKRRERFSDTRLTMNSAEFDYCKFRASFAANQTAPNLTFTNLALDVWWESMI